MRDYLTDCGGGFGRHGHRRAIGGIKCLNRQGEHERGMDVGGGGGGVGPCRESGGRAICIYQRLTPGTVVWRMDGWDVFDGPCPGV